MIQLTERGRDLVQRDEDSHVPEDEEHDLPGCVLVQPNFEVMVFLDGATLGTLYELYRVGRRIRLADRSAVFQLAPDTVQRGYAGGLDAEQLIGFLEQRSQVPLPDAVSFQLRDWERIHRRLVLYADGILLRHHDPERLDLIVGQLKHDARDSVDFDIVRLSATAAFLPQTHIDYLDRMLDREGGLLIDYLGPLQPSLQFVDRMVVELDLERTDIVTLSELERIGEVLDTVRAPRRHIRLRAADIASRWPQDALDEVLNFLRPRVIGGLPAEQEIVLRTSLGQQIEALAAAPRVVVNFPDEAIADLVASIPRFVETIEERYGPRAIAVDVDEADHFLDQLEELGIEVD